MKYAVLSMDVEDWFHLDYVRRQRARREYSMLDGLSIYEQILSRYGIPSSFFVLGELAGKLRGELRALQTAGHDVGVHGWNHRRPMTMSLPDFREDLVTSKRRVEDAIGRAALGYRAPCYSLDRQRLDIVRQVGFAYDSSRIEFSDHPLYGSIDLRGYRQLAAGVACSGNFLEFEVTTRRVLGRQLPISGGGYLRIFPWSVMRRWIGAHLQGGSLYVLYLHPFELSRRPHPPLAHCTRWRDRRRFCRGRASVEWKLVRLIELLRARGYELTTFRDLRARLLAADPDAGNHPRLEPAA